MNGDLGCANTLRISVAELHAAVLSAIEEQPSLVAKLRELEARKTEIASALRERNTSDATIPAMRIMDGIVAESSGGCYES
jgi:hypothetical protein